ncbi:MAG TPA: hypothetical protein VFH31_01590 [Pyrinomonadaceae bacterium]|nr:hypothetical protein [Pyrinomonadaceae bacterium]
MIGYRRKLIAAAIIGFVSMGVFAQKGKGDKPPKPKSTVVVVPKREKPPQSGNQGEKRGPKRDRPEEELLNF